MNSSLARLCAGLASIPRKHGLACPAEDRRDCRPIVVALEQFQESVRYLNTRRTTGAILRLESEADVQDALFLMLRPWIRELIPEDPNSRIAKPLARK